METAADDFRIFWDNADGIHHIYEEVPLKDILTACERPAIHTGATIFSLPQKLPFREPVFL